MRKNPVPYFQIFPTNNVEFGEEGSRKNFEIQWNINDDTYGLIPGARHTS